MIYRLYTIPYITSMVVEDKQKHGEKVKCPKRKKTAATVTAVVLHPHSIPHRSPTNDFHDLGHVLHWCYDVRLSRGKSNSIIVLLPPNSAVYINHVLRISLGKRGSSIVWYTTYIRIFSWERRFNILITVFMSAAIFPAILPASHIEHPLLLYFSVWLCHRHVVAIIRRPTAIFRPCLTWVTLWSRFARDMIIILEGGNIIYQALGSKELI